MVLQYSNTRSITANHGDLTVGVLREFLEGLPNDIVVSVSHYVGDAREPSQTTLTAQNPRKQTSYSGSDTNSFGDKSGNNYFGPYGMGVPFGE